MPDSQTLVLIIAATVAAVLLFRLYTVLGRRTGHEPPPPGTRPVPAVPDLRPVPAPGDPSARGLMDIQLADRSFDKAHFLKGARAAYELIQKAFANGDRIALRPLLSDDVLAAFEAEIAARGGAGAPSSLSAITDARITAAELHGDHAEITVAFRAQFAKDGAQSDVGDVWTFSRRLGAADPNWVLVATSGESA